MKVLFDFSPKGIGFVTRRAGSKVSSYLFS